MKTRETIAVVIAIVAIMTGAAYGMWRGLNHSIPFYVGGVWALLAIWVDPPLLGHKRLGQIYQEAKGAPAANPHSYVQDPLYRRDRTVHAGRNVLDQNGQVR